MGMFTSSMHTSYDLFVEILLAHHFSFQLLNYAKKHLF